MKTALTLGIGLAIGAVATFVMVKRDILSIVQHATGAIAIHEYEVLCYLCFLLLNPEAIESKRY